MTTPFASVALFRRDGKIKFKPPRKERAADATQARKAAVRYWRRNLAAGDTLTKIIVLRGTGGFMEIAERPDNGGVERPWVEYHQDIAAAIREPHLAACAVELGLDPSDIPHPMPDTLEINGVIYRREI